MNITKDGYSSGKPGYVYSVIGVALQMASLDCAVKENQEVVQETGVVED